MHSFAPLKIVAITCCCWALTALPAAHAHDYGEALQKSLHFYEAQQAGPLPSWNRVAWRGDSVSADGDDVGVDLSGGWFDAGDHVKFGFPMASTATLLAWGGVDYHDAYEQSGQLPHLLNNLRFVNDYFINAHVSPNELYGQVGLGAVDHSFWGPAEVVHLKIPHSREAMKIDLNCPGPDLAAETAAAMAASSMVFAPTDGSYAATLLNHAQQLYEFAENTTGVDGKDNAYSNCITDAQSFYNSTHGLYWDEMAWGAIWLWRATGDDHYLDRALFYYDLMGSENQTQTPVFTWSLNWNDKAYGVYVLMAELVGDARFHEDAQRYLDHWSVGNGHRTPGGVVVVDSSGWGVNRYAANIAFLALHYAEVLGTDHALYDRYHSFGKQQIDYILGDNPLNRSFLVGYGQDFPTNVHHRTSHGSWADSLQVPEQQRHVLYGAVVAGPDADTNYTEDRGDFIMNEVAIDYNSGFTGAVAALYGQYGGPPLPESEFPPPTEPKEDEYLIGAQINSSGTHHIEIRAVIQNRSTTPAAGRDDLYFRYFYDLSEVYAAGLSAADVTISTAFSQATSVTGPHPWGDPASRIYYAEVSFTGEMIFPGGQSDHRREVQFRAALPTSAPAGIWDNSNDPSWDPGYATTGEQFGMPAPGIPVYGSEGLLWGQEPVADCGGDTGINCIPEAENLQVTTDYETPVDILLVGHDQDGFITDYTVTAAPTSGLLSGTGAERAYTPDPGFFGEDSFTYTVADDQGAESPPAIVSVTVEQPDVPSVSIDAPANGAQLVAGADFTLTFAFSNAAGVRVEQDGLAIGDVTDGNSVVLTAPTELGSFTVTLTALDAAGNPLDASDSVTLEAVSDVPPGDLSCAIGNADVWGDGYVLNNITVTNNGASAVDPWEVSLMFQQPPQVTNSWNASLSVDGLAVIASGGSLAPGAAAVFGFQGTHGGNFVMPECTVAGDTDPPPPNTPPVASFVAAPTEGTAPLAVTFDASASSDVDGDTLTFSWDFGDGNTATGASPVHTYTQAGSYTASLTVSDGMATDTASTDILVDGDAPPAGACEFVIDNEWNSGYTGQIHIANQGDSPIEGWQVSWTFTDGASLTDSWNAQVTGSNPYSATGLDWNSNIQPGQSVSFGFQVNKGSGSVQIPTVTGDVCN